MEFLRRMKDISLNDILEKMSKRKICKGMATSARCDFGYISPPEINSAVKLNFDRQ